MAPREPHSLLRALMRAMFAALGVGLATRALAGVEVEGPSTLILAGLLLGVVNAVVRPLAILFTLPLTFLSLGIFLLVVNAGMLGLVAAMLPGLRIASFSDAFLAALLVSLVSWIGSWIVGPRGRLQISIRRD